MIQAVLGRIGKVSIHAPRVGRDPPRARRRPTWRVSIHAPRVGRDKAGQALPSRKHSFNSRAPRGARLRLRGLCEYVSKFQFTRPAWGATSPRGHRKRRARFNSRAPRGARPVQHRGFPQKPMFQFTRPAWGATRKHISGTGKSPVSIHAPRVGRDWRVSALPWAVWPVSIHAPRVGRDTTGISHPRKQGFQFTRPAWGATATTQKTR